MPRPADRLHAQSTTTSPIDVSAAMIFSEEAVSKLSTSSNSSDRSCRISDSPANCPATTLLTCVTLRRAASSDRYSL